MCIGNKDIDEEVKNIVHLKEGDDSEDEDNCN